ncbi:MAG: hypothetical protein HYV28_19030, partial [Ignavibacteriales bacterium]|nr:hypothetical protein [Ignavibacteriales bacterium]
CFKVSTQLNYKIFKTSTGTRIETPHDFSEINIADRYTTSARSFYKERLIEVVKKRLALAKVKNTDPEDFFPEDREQEAKIKNLFTSLKAEQRKLGKSEKQAYDFAYRYSRPNFIRDEIQGNRNTYSYAGFQQLVNISSGNIRQFLE